MERFFGGSPGLVVIRLMIISVIVGVILSALGLDPYSIIDSFRELLIRVYNMGFDTIEWALRYFLLGAVLVVPVWLISRVLKSFGRGGRADTAFDRKSRHSDL